MGDSRSTRVIVGTAILVLAVGLVVGPVGAQSLSCADGDTGALYQTDAGLTVSDDRNTNTVATNPFVNETTFAFENVTVRATGAASVVLESATSAEVCVGAVEATQSQITLAPDGFTSLTIDGSLAALAYGPIAYDAGTSDLTYNASDSIAVTLATAPEPGTTVAAVDTDTTLANATVSSAGTLALTLPAGDHAVDLQMRTPDPPTPLAVTATPASLDANQSTDVTLTVTNQTEAPVPEATVSLAGVGVDRTVQTTEGTATVSVTPSTSGSIVVTATHEEYTDGTATIDVRAAPDRPTLPDFENPANDTTGDGKLNDLNGDTEFNILDVVALHANLDSRTVQENAALFDFNDEGEEITILDVVALYADVQ